MENRDPLFSDATIVHSYSRAQALEEGVLVNLAFNRMLASICRQHYKHPIACTAAVFDIIKRAVDNKEFHNDYPGVVHDILYMSRALHREINESTILFRVVIQGAGLKTEYDFKLVVGPGDDAKPVITIMLPNED